MYHNSSTKLEPHWLERCDRQTSTDIYINIYLQAPVLKTVLKTLERFHQTFEN